MSPQAEVIIHLAEAGALVAYILFNEYRVSRLKGKLAVSEEGNQDAAIVIKTRALSDDALDDLLSAKLGRAKPPTEN